MDFCHLREVYTRYMGKVYWALLETKVLDAAKTAFKKVVYKTAEVTGKNQKLYLMRIQKVLKK